MELLKFADEIEEENGHKVDSWKIMIADDEQGIHDITKMALKDVFFKGKDLSFVSAYSGSEAMQLIKDNPDIALVLLDIVMEDDDSGLQVTKYIRDTLQNRSVRIIFRTGQPGYAPEDEVVLNYDINDYKTKSELTTEKLFTAVICAVRSYSELIEKEELVISKDKLLFSLDLLKRAVETMDLGITITNIEGDIIYMNKAEAQMHGYSADELIGRDVSVLAPLNRKDTLPLKEMLKNDVCKRESVNMHKNKWSFPVQLMSTVVRNDEELPIAIITSCEDITERKRMEEELKQINENLDELVRERTSQLADANEQLKQEIVERKKAENKKQELFEKLEHTHEELKQSQDQLIQSEKMASLGQLVAGIAHEINNPLGFVNSSMGNLQKFISRIFGLLDAYEEIELPKESRTAIIRHKEEINFDYVKERVLIIIERSKDGIDRIKKIILDLKTFSRLDAADLIDTDINESIDITLNMLYHEFKDRVEIVKEYGDIPLVRCYSAKLNQVLMNLLINACQAIDGKGEIRIKTAVKDDTIRIDISDTGKGIPEELQKKIFDPFFTTKPVGKGTGLGLSISHKIVREHKGELLVHSVEGEGTTFIIKIPVK